MRYGLPSPDNIPQEGAGYPVVGLPEASTEQHPNERPNEEVKKRVAERLKELKNFLRSNDSKFLASEGEIRIFEGKKYQWADSGYTVRQFYSHSTSEKGPGPGWDTHENALKKYGAKDTSQLPDIPHYRWVPVNDGQINPKK